MKHKLLFLYFSLNSLLLFSQGTIEIPLNYSTLGYAEKDFANKIPIIGTPVDNTLVPTVNAEMNISESGALTYALPIEILKGINNFQPNISLAYNSQSGNGQAGWGWNIVGLSTITRGGKSKSIDGITIGSQFDDTDPFYLDGQRLIHNNASEFVTEKFSKIKITKPSSGEFSFIVQYTDGRVAKYKELISGQNYISAFIDSFNNEIHYTYQIENNVPNITKISYGGTSVTNDKFYINFLYTARKKNIQIFRNGITYVNTKVLSEVSSGSSYSSLFRKYNFTYDFVEDNSIERLRSITVKNESGESLKPLNFNYGSILNAGSVKISESAINGLGGLVKGLGSVTVGNFINSGEKIQPIYQTNLANGGYRINNNGNSVTLTTNDPATQLFSGKVLDLNNQITENDQLIAINEHYIDVGIEDLVIIDNPINFSLKDNVVFEIQNIITGQSRKVTVPVKGGLTSVENYVPDDPYDPYGYGTFVSDYFRDKTRREYIQGDFNNDGLVDFLIIEPQNLNRGNKVYLVELGKLNGGVEIEAIPIVLDMSGDFYNKEVYPIEFDGDGLPELFTVDRKVAKYSIFKIDFVNNKLDIVLANKALSNFAASTPIFFGDFNGDGLTDFLTPQKVYEIPGDDNSGVKMGSIYYQMQTETLLWWKNISTGKGFIQNQENYTDQKIAYLKPSQSHYIKKSTFWQKFWNGKPDEYEYTRYSTHNIIITDFNNDGRSDIITLNKIGSAKYNANGLLSNIPISNLSNLLMRSVSGFPFFTSFTSSITNRLNFYENKNLQGGTFEQLTSYSVGNTRISPLSLILSATEFDFLNVSKSGVYIYDPLTGLRTTIAIDNSNFLEKQIQEVDNGSTVLQRVDYRNMIPSTITDETTYSYKSQSFKYPYYVHNTNSSLYLVNKIHTLFDGKILTKEYRYENGIQHLEGKGFLGFQKTYSSDAYESEVKNGKYINKNPAKAVFWNIQTKDPLMENAVIVSTYGGINKFFTENKITNQRFDRGNHQYLILSTDEISKDFLKKITISKKYVYDENDDLKLKTAYADYDGIASSISKYTYQNEFSNGDHYFYGKISAYEDTTYKGQDLFGTREENDYDPVNGSVYETRKYSNQANAPPIVTNYTYDSTTGNISSQTLSTLGIPSQTTSYEYDSTKRYVNKTTTSDGLIAIANVNALGRTLDETAPLGNLKTYYSYDSWGNITSITDFLGKITTISKNTINLPTGGIYNLSKKREGGVESIVTFDKFDREIQSKTQSINGKWLVAKTEYDIYGKKTRISETHFEGETPKWNSVEYDELNRPIKNTSFTQKVITTCYEGMKVTVDDGYKKTSKTLDAMGNTIRHQDHGGVINYSYYPNGALKETNYEGIKTTFEIDGWGNKKKIVDPSAGTFTYEYDNIGRITKETNLKGKTDYTYDALGRPLTETTTGSTAAENTNIFKTYTYNPTTKLPETITGTSNGKTFTYTTIYDNYYRIKGKKEVTPEFTYESSTTFDAFGKADVVKISTTLLNPAYTSISNIKNIYDTNGILLQQNDVDAGKMVWHVSDVNAQGQTTQMEYGNGYSISNQYNPSDFSLFNIKHQNTTNGTVALDIDYNYNVNKGVLNWRRNNTFNKKEDFTYDTLNRLLTETVNSVLTTEYTYDKRGRITSNSELGKYNYNNSDYKLQNIAFNANGQNVDAQRGFASASYNAFKSPLQITLAGKEDLSFEYSILKTRSAMTSSVTGKIRYYSSDFAVEITKTGNKTEIVTYLTGDPYSANYIKKEVLNGTTLSQKENYFLHRDNLGSILAITKATDGAVVEKRFFDAWGNLKSLVNSAGTLITDAQQLANTDFLLDRGYTGHEHLWKAGLINMNARLYDPILRKFLSADNYVQDPFNTQSYDRYSYAFNNPLLFTDPTGNIAFLAVIAIAVAVGIASNGIMNMINGVPFWYGMGKAGVMGAISGAISFGIGSLATSTFGVLVSTGKALFEAGLHAISGGLMSAVEGGKFMAGALSGFVSSMVSSGIQSLGQTGATVTNVVDGKGVTKAVQNGFGQNYMKAVMVVAGGLSGGLSSTVAGGNFWQGMRQGLITSGLNHLAHMGASAIEYKNKLQQYLSDNDIDASAKPTKEILIKYKEIFKEYWSGSAKWAEFADDDSIADWEDSTNRVTLDKDGAFLTEKGRALGLTNDLSGRVLLSKVLLEKTNYAVAKTFIHEQIHSMDIISGFARGLWGNPIENDIIEYRAYDVVKGWTGYLEHAGQNHLLNIVSFHLLKFR